jgi:hypothetical protein
MDCIYFNNTGNFNKTFEFLNGLTKGNYMTAMLEKYGKRGVEALAAATPIDTGLTASSWDYEIEEKNGSFTITWVNSHIEKGINIALILQYGHATRNGGYVRGIDYINPALKPIFDAMAAEAWKEVTST